MMNAGTSNQHRRAPRVRAGFTLIELMVVMAIIAMLVGLTVAVIVIVHRKSEIRETENILRLLDVAMQDWEQSTERQLSWGTNPAASQPQLFDLSANLDGKAQMSELLQKLKKTPSSAQMLAQINQDYFISQKLPAPSTATRLLVRDAWGNEIVVVHPGRLPNPSVYSNDADTVPPAGAPYADADGTIRTSSSHGQTPSPDVNENKYGICQSRRVCFVSAGPDSQFGNLQLNEVDPANRDPILVKLAGDNLYSTPLLKENP